MSDLISRQAAIDAFGLPIFIIKGEENAERVAEYLKAVLQRIKELPSAEPEQQWIPCSERLPEKAGKYLFSVQNGNVYAGTFDQYSHRFQCAAVAWMPLPEPYQEEEK